MWKPVGRSLAATTDLPPSCVGQTRRPANYLCRANRIDKNGNVVANIAKTGRAWSKDGRLDKRQRPTEGGSVDVFLSLVKLLVHKIFLYRARCTAFRLRD